MNRTYLWGLNGLLPKVFVYFCGDNRELATFNMDMNQLHAGGYRQSSSACNMWTFEMKIDG